MSAVPEIATPWPAPRDRSLSDHIEGRTRRRRPTTYDWHSFDHCLLKAFEAQEITEETALLYCNDKGRVRRTVDLLKKRNCRGRSGWAGGFEARYSGSADGDSRRT
jgi:hypothetical protein